MHTELSRVPSGPGPCGAGLELSWLAKHGSQSMQITEKPPRETIGGNAVVTAVCARLFFRPVHPSSTRRQPHFNCRGQSARALKMLKYWFIFDTRYRLRCDGKKCQSSEHCHSWITEPHYVIHTSNDTSPQCCGTELTQLTCCQRMKVINPGESKCIIKMQILGAPYNSKWIISNYLSKKKCH